MLAFLKIVLLGLGVIVLSPLIVVIAALFFVYCLIIFLVMMVHSIIVFFSGGKVNGDLKEDIKAKEILKKQAIEKLNPTPVVNNSTNNQYQQNIGTVQNINIHTSSLNIPTNQNGGLVIPTLDNQNNQFIDTTNNPKIEQRDVQQIEQTNEEETEENNL